MIEQIIVTPKVGTIHTTLLTAGKYCEKDIFVDLYPLVAHEQKTALAAGINQGKTEGKEEAYNAFWDVFQDNGGRTDYKYAFRLWGDANYKPKYPVVIKGDGSYAYQQANITKCIDVDTSGCSNFAGMFGATGVAEIGTLDTTGFTGQFAGLFNSNYNLKKVGELILSNKGDQTFSNTAFNCPNLEDISITGTIGDSLTMANCSKLTKASITSVINALSTTASGKTLTLSTSAKSKAFTADEWATLIATKTNWTISLA